VDNAFCNGLVTEDKDARVLDTGWLLEALQESAKVPIGLACQLFASFTLGGPDLVGFLNTTRRASVVGLKKLQRDVCSDILPRQMVYF